MKAMILAAGLGTRLRPMTHKKPKPLLELGGFPLLHHIIGKLSSAGCEAVVINTHHLPAQIEAFIVHQQYSLPVITRHEPTLLETGGGIKNVSDFWDNRPFLVVNGDIDTDIDLKEVYRYHLTGDFPVTMVLHDREPFNNVWVDTDNQIVGFGQNAPCPPGETSRSAACTLLAYTGIQVIDPIVLGHIPEKKPTSIIDTYCDMIREGLGVNGLVIEPLYWHDIGTLAGYQNAARESMARKAIAENHTGEVQKKVTRARLKGDGSDRLWFRFSTENASTVIVDHGPPEKQRPCEADAYYTIGKHLRGKGVPVPHIFGYHASLGILSMEDLGDIHLQDLVQSNPIPEEILGHYKRLIDVLIVMGVDGAIGFDTTWTFQTSHYDKTLVLEKECRYFVDAFLNEYMGMDIPFTVLATDFDRLAAGATDTGYMGFLHRDFQSRNILVCDGIFHIIDFQGGRLGPLQYDLASLLIDPYVALSGDMQEMLFEYYVGRLSERMAVDRPFFETGYRYCQVTRNLQALGAFAFLSRSKGKTIFENYIPSAVKSLKNNIRKIDLPETSRLKHIIEQLK